MLQQMNEIIRSTLIRLESTLKAAGDERAAARITRALSGTDEALVRFLQSGDLWGGMGSIADQAACCAPREVKRECEALLADLGEAQAAAGIGNAGAEKWAGVFREW